MVSINYYSNALDELQSHITPEQFQYLLSVLSSDNPTTPTESCSLTLDTDDSLQGTSWSNSSELLQQSPKEEKLSEKRERSVKNVDTGYQRKISQLQHDPGERFGTFSSKQLVLPLSKLSRGPNLLKLSSLDSTITSTNIGEENSSISRYGVTSKDSVLALPGLSLAVKENLAENIQLVQSKYAQVPLPLIEFRGIRESFDQEKISHNANATLCSHLPICKKIAGKYSVPLGRKSRSSSLECVKAETLPDLDNPMLEIAGKIANEPTNPFPVLKNVPFKKHPRMSMTTSTKRVVGASGKTNPTLDGFRIEQGIDRELDMLQDYKNVCEFFNHGEMSHSKARKTATVTGGIARLSKRVTNPLYKEYDLAGYQKSEDELALECIEMICDDFNKWIKSLTTIKKKNGEKCDHENEKQGDVGGEKDTKSTEEETQIIGPEFLIQILRTELELPEQY